MKRTHSKNSLFLMEIILNLLLFSVLLVVGLQFFIHAHTRPEETTQLHQAVSSCASVAAVFERGDGSLDDLLETYRYSVNLDDKIVIYLDTDFNECKRKKATYFLTVSLATGSSDTLSKASIVCSDSDAQVLYQLTACHYNQLKANQLQTQSMEGI